MTGGSRTSEMQVLEAKDLGFAYGRGFALRDVSFHLRGGEFVGLIGPNGAGKSTLLKLLAGITRADRGAVLLDGANITTIDERVMARKVAYLPQQRRAHWDVSVRRLIELGRLPYMARFGGLNGRDQRAVDCAVELMDLGRYAERPVSMLSGGELARVHVARALAQDARFILADEPSAGLDPAHQISLMQCFSRHAKSGGSVLASLHDLGLAARWCDRVLLIDDGCVVMEGAPGDVLTEENLAEVYNIRAQISTTEDGFVISMAGLLDDPEPGR